MNPLLFAAVFSLLVLLGPAVPGTAQTVTTSPPLLVGETVRVQVGESDDVFADVFEGALKSGSGSSLIVEVLPDSMRLVDLTGSVQLDVAVPGSPHQGAVDGALVGGIFAGVISGIAGYAATGRDRYPGCNTMCGIGVVYAVPGGAVGAFLGGLIGYHHPPKRWRPVEVRREP